MKPANLLLFGAVLAGAHAATPAGAQTAAPVAPAAAAAPTVRPAVGEGGFWTLQAENDAVSFDKTSDRYYSNGFRVAITTASRHVPDTLKHVATLLWGSGETRLAIDLSHQIYTPADTKSGNPPLGDRPFAGVLMGNFGLVQDGANTRSSLVLGLGVVGPAAGGDPVQNRFHELIGQRHVRGWATQLHNEPLLQLTSERVWRVPITALGPLETDALPSLTAGVGNLRTYIQTGVTLRLGQGLQSDFGATRMRPGLTGGDHYRTVRPFAWYVFVGAEGRGIAHDITLDGNSFRNSRSVRKQPFVGELQAGLGVIAYGVRLTYVHRVSTREFRGQTGRLHQIGSVALTMRF